MVWKRGSEPRQLQQGQQEQLVIQYVESHGSITRRETEELFKISRDQAYRLLQVLKRKGILRQIGNAGRAVRYARDD